MMLLYNPAIIKVHVCLGSIRMDLVMASFRQNIQHGDLRRKWKVPLDFARYPALIESFVNVYHRLPACDK